MTNRLSPHSASNDGRVPRVAVAVFALMVVGYAGRLVLTFAKPFATAGTASGAIGTWAMLPLAAAMLASSLRGRGR